MKRPRDDCGVRFDLASSYRRAYPDDRCSPLRLAPYFDRLMLPEFYRQKPGAYRRGAARAPNVGRYFSARRTAPALALMPFRLPLFARGGP
jgi:hypothetical protein